LSFFVEQERMYKKILPFFVAGCLALPTQAFASDDLETEPVHNSKKVDTADTRPPVEHWLTLQTSLYHLLVPMFEIGGDYAIDRHFSAGLTFGVAFLPIKPADLDNNFGTGVRAIGATVRAQYYVLGDFDHGISLGLQGTGWSTRTTGNTNPSRFLSSEGSVNQYAIFVGIKHAFRLGFMLSGQVGYQYNAKNDPVIENGKSYEGGEFGADPTEQLRDSSEFASMRSPLLLNLNVGWSF